VLRLFSSFPGGAPGVALLLLRAALAVSLMDHGRECVWAPTPQFWCAVFGALAGLLCFGFITPIVAYLSCFAGLGDFALAGYGGWQFVLLFSLTAIALALLGPGAYSIDAKRFGHRLIVFPPSEGKP
jgi:uncharacterized membrane protein YphA (DoxX/SURF4 family)